MDIKASLDEALRLMIEARDMYNSDDKVTAYELLNQLVDFLDPLISKIGSES